jgi:hypothetical protein
MLKKMSIFDRKKIITDEVFAENIVWDLVNRDKKGTRITDILGFYITDQEYMSSLYRAYKRIRKSMGNVDNILIDNMILCVNKDGDVNRIDTTICESSFISDIERLFQIIENIKHSDNLEDVMKHFIEDTNMFEKYGELYNTVKENGIHTYVKLHINILDKYGHYDDLRNIINNYLIENVGFRI